MVKCFYIYLIRLVLLEADPGVCMQKSSKFVFFISISSLSAMIGPDVVVYFYFGDNVTSTNLFIIAIYFIDYYYYSLIIFLIYHGA